MSFDLSVARQMCDAVDADLSLVSKHAFFRDWVVRTATRLNDATESSDDEDAPPVVETTARTPADDQYETDDDEEAPPDNSAPFNIEPREVVDERASAREAQNARDAHDPSVALSHYIEAARLAPTSRRLADCAVALLDMQRYADALIASERAVALNPDSARALRTRSRVHWMLNDSQRAHTDMCEAQRIDYNDEFDALHAQMKEAAMKEKGEMQNVPEPSALPGMPHGGLPAGMDFASLMNNPAVMGMAQNLMQNPDLMQQMMSNMGGKRRM